MFFIRGKNQVFLNSSQKMLTQETESSVVLSYLTSDLQAYEVNIFETFS